MNGKKPFSEFVIVTIFLSMLFLLNTYHPYVLAGGELGYTLQVSVGSSETLTSQDGKEYTIKVLDVNLASKKALISLSLPDGRANMVTLSKDQEISLGAMTLILKDIFVNSDGAIKITFLIYGLSAVEGYVPLLINATPIGAEVYINQMKVGYTPLTYLAKPGDYSILIRYQDNEYKTRVSITTEDVRKRVLKKIHVNLLNKGMLNINSSPVGADVLLNGIYIGKTPVSGYMVWYGTYKLSVYKEGFKEYTTTINVTDKTPINISVILIPSQGRLNIISHPLGAAIYIDGKYAGDTPLNITLSEGKHEIKLIKTDYEIYSSHVLIQAGKNMTLNATLIPKFGYIAIESNVAGSEVYIDNQKIGTVPIEKYKLSTGTHNIKVVKEGYLPFIQNITITPGKELKITATLSPVYSFINIYSNIQGAEVYIDKELIGETPLKEYKLVSGNHTLEIRADGYKVFTKNITIEPGKTLTLNAKLVPLPSQTGSLQQNAQTPADMATQFQYIAPQRYPYAGILIFAFLTIILVVMKKHKTIPKVPNFPPQLLKKYEPLEFLGEGGFAKVFKVKRKKDKKIIALKVFSADEKAKKFFTKEVKAWKLLDHPNIVKLYNAFDEPIPHLEIEFIEGYTMDGKLIRDLEHYPKPVDEKLALKFIEGIAEGLRHAHSMQVYHRDLKPSNILLKGDLTPKITDFGLAKIGSKSTTTTTKALTPLYAAPEQIDERTYGHTDHRTDIYQLGVILYELLTGKLPYEGSSHVVVLAKITNPEIKPKPPSMYNLTLAKYDKMFEKLLAKQKEKRYQSLDEFLEEFRGLVELLKEREKLKESLRVTKETITKTRDELEIKKLNLELLRLLIQNTILSVRINDKEEALNGLYDLIPFTRKHRAELEEAIRQVQLFIEEGLVIPEEFIESLRILLHKIEREE